MEINKKKRSKTALLPVRRPSRALGVDDAKTFCSTSWISFCPCSAYFETTRVLLEDSTLSFRRVAPSSSRLVADSRRSTFAVCVTVSR